MSKVHLRGRPSTPRLTHIYDQKLSLHWSELKAAIHCSATSAFTVETYLFHNRTTVAMMTTITMMNAQSTIIMHNHTSPTLSKIFDYIDINGSGGHMWPLLRMHQISSWLPEAPRWWLGARQERQRWWPIFGRETALWFETTTSERHRFQQANLNSE